MRAGYASRIRRAPTSLRGGAGLSPTGSRILRSLIAGSAAWLVWTSQSGTFSATDDATRVPRISRPAARQLYPSGLECYRKTTTVGAGATARAAACTAEQQAPIR